MADDVDLPFSVQVHERGDAALDGILRLIDEAARPRPLPEVLAALCAEVSAILGTPIVSIYLRHREPGGEEALRMAANVGFPAGAASRVRLRIGEGIVGSVAEALRPVSLQLAPEDTRFRYFPELGEERFPIFLAVPLLVGRRAEGVLVLQRARREFEATEVVLATALATSFAYALERARVRRSEASPSKESRRARLEGAVLAPGMAIGRVETLPTFEGLAARWAAREEEEGSREGEALSAFRARITRASLGDLLRDLSGARRRVAPKLEGDAARAVEAIALLEEDSRFLGALADDTMKDNVALHLRKVAREYASAPYRAGAQAASWLLERAEEVEAICLLLAARSVGERVPSSGAVLVVPDRFGVVIALAAVDHDVAAIAVGGPVAPESPGAAVMRAAGLPAIAAVGGLFAWARAGDVVLVDGGEGLVRVNPSAAQIARFRQAERERRAKSGDGTT